MISSRFYCTENTSWRTCCFFKKKEGGGGRGVLHRRGRKKPFNGKTSNRSGNRFRFWSGGGFENSGSNPPSACPLVVAYSSATLSSLLLFAGSLLRLVEVACVVRFSILGVLFVSPLIAMCCVRRWLWRCAHLAADENVVVWVVCAVVWPAVFKNKALSRSLFLVSSLFLSPLLSSLLCFSFLVVLRDEP